MHMIGRLVLIAACLAGTDARLLRKPAASAQAVSIHPAWIRQELMKPEVSGSGAVGGLMGFCTGLACRKAGEAAAVGLGAAFCFLGVLAKSGYITIDIPKIEKSLLMMLDMNKDGKLDDADYKFVSERAITVLQDNGMVATGAFAAGFAYGFYGYGAS